MSSPLRLCLDLNIYCAALYADRLGRQDTASQSLVNIVRSGTCVFGSVQLIISWGMLERLYLTLREKMNIPDLIAQDYVEIIQNYAELGIDNSPQLTLGGTGIIPLRDIEDRHVLETALAGQASILVTENLKDFLSNDTVIIESKIIESKERLEHLIYYGSKSKLHIVKSSVMMNWIRKKEIPPFNQY